MQNNNKKAIQRSSTGFAFASLAIAVAAFAANDVQAGETFRFDNGATLDWSVTTSYGLGIRMEDADSKLLDGQANADDGNHCFDRHSLMTHRVTALGEMILRKGLWSGSAWVRSMTTFICNNDNTPRYRQQGRRPQ